MSQELLAEERRRMEDAKKPRPGATATGVDDFLGAHRRPGVEKDGAPGRAAAPEPQGAFAGEGAGGQADSRSKDPRLAGRQDLRNLQQMREHRDELARSAWEKSLGQLEGRVEPEKLSQVERYKRNLGQGQVVADMPMAATVLELLEANSLDVARQLDKPRSDFSETGAWVSTLVTGRDGKGSARVKLPESTTGFKIVVRGATRDTYVGEGESEVRTSRKLQVGLAAPLVLTEGDRVTGRAILHNLSGRDISATLSVSTQQGSESGRSEDKADLKHGQDREFPLTLTAASAADIRLKLAVDGGGHSDALESVIPVLPFGMDYRDGRSGYTRDGASFQLGLPAGREYTRRSMIVQVGRDPGRDLVAAALGQGFRPRNCFRVDSTNLSLASRGIAALLVLDYLEKVGRSTPADAARLRGLADSCVARLVQAQAPDGGMAWVGRKNGDLRTTAQAVRFLAMATRRGMEAASAPLTRAQDWLLARMRRARTQDRCRAALAIAKRLGFTTLNGLHRNRAGMDAESLAFLALAWHQIGRSGLAAEVETILRNKLKLQDSGGVAHIEVVGLAATALLTSNPRDPLGLRAIEWLKSRRLGVSWGTPEATAAALWALTTAGGFGEAAASYAEVTVTVNGKELGTVPASVKDANTSFEVPSDWLRDSGNQVQVKVQGRGEVHYTAMLTGFARGFRKEDRRRDIAEIERKYMPAFLRHEGKVLRPGFGVVTGRRYETFENQITRLAVGESGRVRLSFRARGPFGPHLSPMVVEEPIPAGCSVPSDSIQGNYDHMTVEPTRMTFYFREGVTRGTIQYEIQARFVGDYRVLPTRAYGALRPDLLAYGPEGSLKVLPRESTEKDPYRLTPDELYHLGKALFDAGRLKEAGGYLARLLTDWQKEDYHLRDGFYKDVARMMLFVAVDQKDSKSIVRFFEVLKELYPDLVIPFDKIVSVGSAYLDLGEFEQAVLVFRATAESSFLKEAAVANTLKSLGEVKASLRFLMRLLLSYPDINTIRISLYSIGQELAALAARTGPGAAVDERVGRAEQLRAAALAMFREFLVMYPEDPLAEEVSFAWATTLVEGKELGGALEVSQAALERYPDSTFADELLYTAGYVNFALGKQEEALAILRRVATEEFPLPNGSRGASENRYHAIYLQGQIYHAMGDPAKALAEYDKVKERFSDAAEAEDFFLRKRLSLPEVSSFALDKDVCVDLSYRNLKDARIKIYRVDLMRLYILEKSLNDIRGIQLYGIKPHAEMSVKLGDGRDYRDKTKALRLSLEQPGAYLVVCQAGDKLATGMVLRTDLRIVAQEFLDVGRLRVNVQDKDGYVAGAHVKVIGSGDQKFQSGETDLRGIHVASALVGQATVIVRKGDQYAFFRGKGINQPGNYRPPARKEPEARKDGRPGQQKGQGEFKAWGNNFRANDLNRAKQVEWLQNEVMNKQQKGVEVYRTK